MTKNGARSSEVRDEVAMIRMGTTPGDHRRDSANPAGVGLSGANDCPIRVAWRHITTFWHEYCLKHRPMSVSVAVYQPYPFPAAIGLDMRCPKTSYGENV